jgi:hypothetical protein
MRKKSKARIEDEWKKVPETSILGLLSIRVHWRKFVAKYLSGN